MWNIEFDETNLLAGMVGESCGLTPAELASRCPGNVGGRFSVQRALRYLGSCLSFASIIGLLWAAVDEESLTWQDHISKTLPTFRVPDSNFVRRR